MYDIMDKILQHMAKTPSAGWKRPPAIAQEMDLQIEDWEVTMCCSKMSRDGYLQKSDKLAHMYVITFEGVAFIKQGGYSALHKNETESKILQEKKMVLDIANAQRVYDSYWVTFGIAIAAFLISVILLVLKLKE